MKNLIFILLFLPLVFFGQNREKLRNIYTKEIGIREVGKNAGAAVFRYQKAAGVKSGMAWCGSFVYWVFVQSGFKLKIIAPAQANSWFIDKNKIIVVRGEVKKMSPQPGDLIGLVYSGTRVGHVGFYDKEDSKFYITVEGNTGGEGTREEGVHRLKRIKRQVTYISNHVDL